MQTILLFIITLILSADFYIRNKDIFKKIKFKKQDNFFIQKKWVWDKIIEELEKDNS